MVETVTEAEAEAEADAAVAVAEHDRSFRPNTVLDPWHAPAWVLGRATHRRRHSTVCPR